MFRSFRDRRPSKAVLLALAAISVIGAAMRLYGLSNQSLWFDEVCSWHTAMQPTFAGIWSGDIQWNMYPPLYGLVLRAAIELFGSAEWALRLPSAITGIAAIPLMYLLGARIFSDAEGLIAAGFSAFSMFTLYFAQEARPYAILLCCLLTAVLSWTYLYEAWAQNRNAPRFELVTCFAASVCMAYLHYFGLLFVLLHGLATFALLATTRRGLNRAIAFYAGTAIAFTPWLPSMAWHLRHQSEGPQNPPVESNVAVSFWEYLNSLFNHGQTATLLALIVTASALFFIVVAAIRVRAQFRHNSEDLVNYSARIVLFGSLLAWLLLPFLIAYVKSSVSASVFTHRNLIVSLPAVYLLVARGMTSLPIPARVIHVGAAVVLIAMSARTITSGYYTAPHKDQFREAVAVVTNQEAQYPNAALVVYAQLPFAFDYYLERFGSTLRPALVGGKEKDIETMRAFVRDRKPAYIWYLCTEPFPQNGFVDYLNTDFRVVGVQQFLRANAMLLQPKT
ncbi:MAG: glycosyltransferase family 39 protein [Candidatus Hydrogenedentes bacterium]|nr:glycosyltransferase family 39 protein [Candidatus Hydrogenedentota bacterium]